MKFWCWMGLHRWVKTGGARTMRGLWRECVQCGKKQEGLEGRNDANGRCICWYDRT